jgi:hypothetical protein
MIQYYFGPHLNAMKTCVTLLLEVTCLSVLAELLLNANAHCTLLALTVGLAYDDLTYSGWHTESVQM